MKYKELAETFAKNQKQYDKKVKEIEAKRSKLREEIKKLETRKMKLEDQRLAMKAPDWVEEIIKPIGAAIAEHFGYKHWEARGPFGISQTVSLMFYNEPYQPDTDKPWEVKAISFRQEDTPVGAGTVGIVDYSIKRHYHAPGSVGDINGLNYDTVPIAPDTELKDILKYLKEE